MAFTFTTMYHQADDTPLNERYCVLVEGPSERESEYLENLAIGRPEISDFVQQGLSQGWLTILEEYKRPDQL